MGFIDRLRRLLRRNAPPVSPAQPPSSSPVEPNYEVLYQLKEGRLRRLIRRVTQFPFPPREIQPIMPSLRVPHNHSTTRTLARDPTGRRKTILTMPPPTDSTLIPLLGDADPNTPRPVAPEETVKLSVTDQLLAGRAQCPSCGRCAVKLVNGFLFCSQCRWEG